MPPGLTMGAMLARFGPRRKAGPGASSRETVFVAADALEDPTRLLTVALAEARAGLAEGGIPIGAALFDQSGALLGRGRNRRVQDDDPTMHAETAAFKAAGRRRHYGDTVMVTTLSPCWYCSGLVRQFGIGAVVIGEARTFVGGHGWLAEAGVRVVLLDDAECAGMLSGFVAEHPELWAEDIGR